MQNFPNFNPPITEMTLSGFNDLIEQASTASEELATKKQTYHNTVEIRRQAFKGKENSLKVRTVEIEDTLLLFYDKDTNEYRFAKNIIVKLKPRKRIVIETTNENDRMTSNSDTDNTSPQDNITDTDNAPTTNTNDDQNTDNTAADSYDTDEERIRSVSQNSLAYATQLGNFKDLIQTIATYPLYAPTIPEQTIAGLNTFAEQLRIKSTNVTATEANYNEAISIRKQLHQKLNKTISKIKRYTRTQYGEGSIHYQNVKNI